MILPNEHNPLMVPALNPALNMSINPAMNMSINPALNMAINPRMNMSINPRMNMSINPRMNMSINPAMNMAINPAMNQIINPRINNAINPNVTATINGKYIFNRRNHSLIGFVIRVDDRIWISFGLDLIQTGYTVVASPEVMVFYDCGNNWAGQWISNQASNFNIYDANLNWIAFTA